MRNAQDKYFKIYYRLTSQFEGVDTVDVDSHMHIDLGKSIPSSNATINEFSEVSKRSSLKYRATFFC